MCICVNGTHLKTNNKYEYLGTNITTTRITTKLHKIETNLQFVVSPGLVVKLLNKSYTALTKTNETTDLIEIN